MPAAPLSGTGPSFVHRDLTIFNVFASLGIVSILAVLSPALFSPHVKRSATWFGVLTSWIVYAVSYMLLLGRQSSPNPPPHGLCMLQAALVYATPSLCATATTCFAVDFFLKLSAVKLKNREIKPKTKRLLITLPWVLGPIIAAEAILVVTDASAVAPDPNHFYCHIRNHIPSLVNIVIICLCGLVIVLLEAYTAIILYRNWAVFRRLNGDHARIALSTFVRLTLFTFIVSLAIALTLFTATNMGNFVPAWSIVLITLPTISALCFGTQRDILRVWLFWRTLPPLPGFTKVPGPVNDDTRV